MSLFNAYRLRGKLLQTSNLFAVSNARALLKNNPSIAASAISTAAATTLRGLVNNSSSSSNYNIRSNRNVTNNNVLTTRTRSYYSSPSIHTSNLERIEELAEQFPQDASKQEALYKALNEQGRYYEVIQRYDRKEFATNMRCRLQYVKVKNTPINPLIHLDLSLQEDPHMHARTHTHNSYSTQPKTFYLGCSIYLFYFFSGV
eukprot:GEZU01012347.1.p1 GENE.GEZU01012347.1~~GEZU01012347.1.p1  ORF type:complete len:202 (-),score=24.30 GEZU01012347.1:213-818(-)